MNPLRWPPPPKRGRRRIYSSLPVMIRGDRDPSLSSRRCWDFCLPPLSRKTDLLIVTVENYCPLSFPSVSFRFLLSLGVSDQKRIEAAPQRRSGEDQRVLCHNVQLFDFPSVREKSSFAVMAYRQGLKRGRKYFRKWNQQSQKAKDLCRTNPPSLAVQKKLRRLGKSLPRCVSR